MNIYVLYLWNNFCNKKKKTFAYHVILQHGNGALLSEQTFSLQEIVSFC